MDNSNASPPEVKPSTPQSEGSPSCNAPSPVADAPDTSGATTAFSPPTPLLSSELSDFERGRRDYRDGRDELRCKAFFQLQMKAEKDYYFGWLNARDRVLSGYETRPAPPAEDCATMDQSKPGTTKQPRPTPNHRPAVWDLVLADIAERDRAGAAKYGVRLQPHNGRDMLTDAYQEALDLAVYLRGATCERDGR